MKKIDFAIHLFSAARFIGSSHPQRVPVVSLLMLLILAKEPTEWVPGSVLAHPIDGLSSNTLASATRTALDSGLLEKRAIVGGVNGALEWRITPSGQRLVERLLDTSETPIPA